MAYARQQTVGLGLKRTIALRGAIPVSVGWLRLALICLAVPVALQMGVIAWLSRAMIGRDFGVMIGATERWLGGGSFYVPSQVVAPYDLPWGQILYPPQALALFVPFTVLPSVLFVVIPLAITVAMVFSWRPRSWFWLGLLAYLWVFPYTVLIYLAGNPTIWVIAVVALATRWHWVSAFVMFKPSLYPFALLGVRDPRWWIVTAAMAGIAVVLFPLTIDWAHVVLNARGEHSGLLYSIGDLPPALIGVAAWLARTRVVALGPLPASVPEDRATVDSATRDPGVRLSPATN